MAETAVRRVWPPTVRELESKYGVPTAPISSARFAEYVEQDAQNHGMQPALQLRPLPAGGQAAGGSAQVRGRERPRYRQSAHAADRRGAHPAAHAPRSRARRPTRGSPRPRLLKPDNEENLHRLFLESGWTDGLPIVLPTEERVARMLTGTAAEPDEVVGRMTVTIHQEKLEYTVEKVAVNAVMAGAGPEHLPVILALAASEEASMPSSTTSFARMAVVNGPIREEIGMNSGLGALSPFNHANTVIGRAWTLMTINLADARLGETFMGSMGSNMNYNNMTFAENEERSVWEPFHVRKGFKKEESTVSLFQGWSAINSMGAAGCCRPAQEEMLIIMQAFPCLRGSLTLVMDPLVAKHLKEQGFDDPAQLSEYLSENFEMSAGPVLGLRRGLLAGGAERRARGGAVRFLAEAAQRTRMIATVHVPEKINVVVVGGETQAMWLTTDFWHSKTVSVDRWRPETGIYEEDRADRPPPRGAAEAARGGAQPQRLRRVARAPVLPARQAPAGVSRWLVVVAGGGRRLGRGGRLLRGAWSS